MTTAPPSARWPFSCKGRGDCTSCFEALDSSGACVAGINVRTAGFGPEQPEGTADIVVNSFHSLLDDDPVRFVFTALAPGDVPLAARTRVIGATDLTTDACWRCGSRRPNARSEGTDFGVRRGEERQ